MEAIINYFLDSPSLLIAIIVFILCVIIGFFGERYLKKKGSFDKIINNKQEEKTTVQNEEVTKEEDKEPITQPVTSSDVIEGVPLNNTVENPILDNVYPPQNEPQNININQNMEVPYINNDDNINNMF